MRPAQPRAGRQSLQQFAGKHPRPRRMKYLLFLPRGCDTNPRQRWPLILFLHGADERGSDPRRILKNGLPRLVLEQPDFPFIVVSPQCPARQAFDLPALLALLDEVAAQHRVDKRRIYVTGISMGGYAAWQIGIEYPQRFAAIVPICGGGDVFPVYLANPAHERALRALPVWAFHGARDDIVPVAESERMVRVLREAGATDVRLTAYPDAGHEVWTETYKNPQLYEWLLSHERKPAK